MAEYINTLITDASTDALGADAFDSSQSNHDTPLMEGSTAAPGPNVDATPFAGAGPIGNTVMGHGAVRGALICPSPGCFLVFETLRLLRKHSIRTGHQPYRCKCGYETSYKEQWKNHVSEAKRDAFKAIVHVQVASEQPHTCAVQGCHRVCSSASKLEAHVKDTGHKAFQCTCGRGFSRQSSLGRHVDELRNDETGKYRCPLWTGRPGGWGDCGQTFKRLSHLKQHLEASKGDWAHSRTGHDLECLLLPFRKRKPAPETLDKVAATAGKRIKYTDAEPSPAADEKSPALDALANKRGLSPVAFVAVTTGAIASSQDAPMMMPTTGPGPEQTGVYMNPIDCAPWSQVAGLSFSGRLPSSHSPTYANNRSAQVSQALGNTAFPFNSYPSLSQDAYGGPPMPSTGTQWSGYTIPAPGHHAFNPTNTPAAWTTINTNETLGQGLGMQQNAFALAPDFHTSDYPAVAPAMFAPVHPGFLPPTTLNGGQVFFNPPGEGQMMRNFYAYPAFPSGNYDASTMSSFGPGTGSHTNGQGFFANQNLVDGSNAAQPAQGFPGLPAGNLDYFDFDFSGDMDGA